MADEPQSAGTAVAEAPAPFTLESAYKEAQLAVEPPKADAPKVEAQDSDKPATSTEPAADVATSGEEPKSNRQAGKEAYERGLREGQERALAEAKAERERTEATRAATDQRQQFEKLLSEASAPDDGTFEGSQRRSAAQQKLGQLYATNTVTSAAMTQGRNALLAELGADLVRSISTLDGVDADARTQLMQAPSVADFGKLAYEHGRRLEKATWEPEIAKRDATIEQLKGQLASRSPSPEPAGGIRTHGAVGEIKTLEDAYRAAQALHAGT